MAETISRSVYRLLQHLPPPLLRALKLSYRHRRYAKALNEAREAYREHGSLYRKNVLFVAGLPKSGTSWLESMLASYPGYTLVPSPDVTVHEYQFGQSHTFQLRESYFEDVADALVVVKVHVNGSPHNIALLEKYRLPYCVMYRDLRDAAVSYVFYVQRTPWHPEFKAYRGLSVPQGLKRFAQTLLPEWRDWVIGWEQGRDSRCSLSLRYEDLVQDPATHFSRVLDLFELPEKEMSQILESSSFDQLKKKGSFYRKGVAGDWVNHFDDDLKTCFKEVVGDFLVEHGYEEDFSW